MQSTVGQTKDTTSVKQHPGFFVSILYLVLWGSVGLTLLGCMADDWWWAELLLDMRWHFLFAFVCIGIFCLFLRRWRSSALSWLLACFCFLQLQPWNDLQDVAEIDKQQSTIRLMFWNVNAGNNDAESVRKISEQYEIDVLILLEYSNRLAMNMGPIRKNYPVSKELPSSAPFGMAVFSRLEGDFEVKYLDQENPVIHYHATTIAGQSIEVLGIHTYPPISNSGWQLRNRQLETLATFLHPDSNDNSGPVIAGGDFNCVSWATPFRKLVKKCELNRMTHRFLPQATWPTRLGPIGIPIDHVLCSKEVQVLRQQLDSSCADSDHAAVVVEVVVDQTGD